MSDDSGDLIGHVFDQTNGMAEGLEGESDGSASGDDYSAGRRDLENPTIDSADAEPDREGVEDLRDPNP